MTALALLARYWREGLIGLLLVALVTVVLYDGVKLSRCEGRTKDAVALLDQAEADYRVAQAVAAADNMAKVRQVEQANDAKTQEIQGDLEKQLSAARAAGAVYASQLRGEAEAARRADRAAGVPEEADAAGIAADTGRAAVMAEDIRICSDNSVKAAGWQRWYEGLK